MGQNLLLRSMLFTPANNPKMILRAAREEEDAVILDLEDSVPFDEKETARKAVKSYLRKFRSNSVSAFVRINSAQSGLMAADIKGVSSQYLDGVVLPKTESKKNIEELEKILESVQARSKRICIVPLIETPKGLVRVDDIAAASDRIAAIAFGAGDYLREMGAGFAINRVSPEEYFPSLLYARSKIATAARSVGVHAVDTPFFGPISDLEGLTLEARRSRLLGYSGKMLIHPTQIRSANTVFSPSQEEVVYAKKMIQAYKKAESRGVGATKFEGGMIDYAMYLMGVELLARASAIAQKEKSPLLQ